MSIFINVYSLFFRKEFEIIPVETNHSNKSPIVLAGQHLGLESWCVKHIYNYAYKKLMDDYVAKKKIYSSNSDNVDALLMGVLLLNPDISTLWNKRKEMVVERLLRTQKELKFTRLVLSHKFKCNEVFAYRKWLLKQCFFGVGYVEHGTVLKRIINEELDVVSSCAEKCSNNYHAWSHRIWLMKLIYSVSALKCNIQMFFDDEMTKSDKWMSAHVSDYSGLHYRQFLIKNMFLPKNYYLEMEPKQKILRWSPVLAQFLVLNITNFKIPPSTDDNDVKKFLNLILGSVMDAEDKKYTRIYRKMCLIVHELKLNEDFCTTYASHESLWCHRRFVTQQLIMLIFEYFGENRPKSNNNSYSELNERHLKMQSKGNIICTLKDTETNLINDSVSFGKEPKILRCDNHSINNSLVYKALIVNERKFIDERSKAGDQFARQYESWLRIILHLSV